MNEDIPRLLRAIAAGDDARANKHDIIFRAAADEIEYLRREVGHLNDLVEGYKRIAKSA